MPKTSTKILSITLCLLLVLLAGAVIGLGFDATASADGGATEGNATAPVEKVPTFKVIDGIDNYLNIADKAGDTLGNKIYIDIYNNPFFIFQASEVGTIVTGYTLYTADDTSDHPGRNPKAWTLQGSVDGKLWMDIHSVSNDDKLPTVKDLEGCAYTVENTTPYWYYKITFTERQGEVGDDYNLMQLSEMEFTATAPVAEVDSADKFVNAVTKGGNVKLVGDVTLAADVDIYKQAVSLDLNGYVLSGNYKINVYGAASDSSSVLVLKDSRPTATHTTDEDLPIGGVITSQLHLTRKSNDESYTDGGKAYLYADGGTVTDKLYLDTSSAVVDYTGGSMTIFGGVHGSAATIKAGFYYGEVVSTNDKQFIISNKKVIFKNNDSTTYATQIVKSGDKAIMPIEPTKEGYEFIKWYDSATNNYFDHTSTVSGDCTIKAMWLKEVATFADLKGELSDGNSVRLTADITLTDNLLVSGGHNVTIDLNGHVISGGKELQGKGNGGKDNPGPSTKLTIIDSNPTAMHEDDDSLLIGGYLNVDILVTASSNSSGDVGEFHLHANGGTIKKVRCSSFACFIFWSGGNKPSTIEGVFGTTNAKPTVRGGLFYYDQGVDSVDNSVKKVTYKDGDKVYAVLAMNSSTPTKKAVEPIAPTKEGYEFVGWYNGDTKYDFSTVTENITLTAKWKDNAAPVISGVDAESGYCDDQTFTITDDSAVTVTINGITATPVDGKFALVMSDGIDKTIVATDGEDNQTTLVVKFGHTFGEWIDEVPKTCTNDGTAGYKDCSVCNKHFDSNGNELTDLTIQAAHTWSTDTIIEGMPADCTNAGKVAHWHCSACGKNYQSNMTTELTNVVIPAKGHTFGEWIEEVPATSKVEGVKGHKDCSVCNRHFDSNGNEIANLVIEILPQKGLSGGAIAAIAVGGTVVVGAGGFSVFWFVLKKRSFAELVAAAKSIFKK